eukprot:2338970-Pyramimonas_sp.AAC.1
MLSLPAAAEHGNMLAERSPPRMAMSSLSLRLVTTMLALPAAFQSGDSFAIRSPPQGWRGLL